jgi:hypothetical protein
VRCPRCGNDNQDGMRFCGMCGGTLLAAAPPAPARPDRGVSPVPQSSAPATATATRPPAPEVPRPRATETSSASISGPSFLGLNDPPPTGKRDHARSDPHSNSRDLGYLLQDEEEHRGGGGAGKFFLIVLALALAVGFGYLRFRNQLPWLTPGAKKPAASAENADQPAADSSNPTPSGGAPESQPTSNPPAANPPANAPVASAPASSPTAGTNNSPASTPTNTQPTGDAASNAQPNSSAAKSGDNAASSNNAPPSDTAVNKPSEPAAKSGDSSSDDSGPDKESDAAPAEAAPKPKAVRPTAKPQAASKPVDSVAEAQRYLYGRGAAQDCDHGLRLLKPLANQGNAKAMVEMGALYSAGLCTPRDLPTSYRWFAIALRKDPSNQTIQTDLQKLWGEMTQPERQLAIKLTQ